MYTNWREQSKEYLARYLDRISERERERETERMITGNGSEESSLKCEFGLVKMSFCICFILLFFKIVEGSQSV
jgi:hypothetical protein